MTLRPVAVDPVKDDVIEGQRRERRRHIRTSCHDPHDRSRGTLGQHRPQASDVRGVASDGFSIT